MLCFLLTYLFWTIACFVFTGAMVLTFWAFGVDFDEVVIGFACSPKLYSRGKFRIHALVWGSYIRSDVEYDEDFFPDTEQTFEDWELAAESDRYLRNIQSKSVFVRIAIVGSGCLALLMIGYLVFQDETWSIFTTGIVQILQGGVSPRTAAQQYLQTYFDHFQQFSWWSSCALVCVKVASLNAITLGYQSFIWVWEAVMKAMGFGNDVANTFTPLKLVILFTTFVTLLVSGGWLIATVSFCYGKMIG